MANQGAKKRKEENARHMQRLLFVIVACNVVYAVVRFGFFFSSFTWKHWMGLILTSLAYLIPYQQLATMSKPSYSDSGELIDGGFDMTTGGICGYLHDVIYITCFVQISSIISDKFWYTYLVIPGFAAYQLFGFVKGFLSHGEEVRRCVPSKFLHPYLGCVFPITYGAGGEEDEKTKKKREKMERRASRPKFVKSRAR